MAAAAIQNEELAVLRRAFSSFPAFCALLKIVDMETGHRRPMLLTPIQKAYCKSRTNRDVVLKARKVYMTTLEVARDLWWFVTKRGARVVIVVQTEKDHASRRTVQGMLRVALESLRESVPGFFKSSRRNDERFDVETDTELGWHERDATLRIMEAGATVKTANKGGRSQLVNRLHATESAYWEFGEETFNSLLNAMPPRSGEVVIESTPNGSSGFYAKQWKAAVAGTSGFKGQFFPWFEHEQYWEQLEPGEDVRPRDQVEHRLMTTLGVSAEAIKWRRKKIAVHGEDKVAQEFPSDPETCFLSSGRNFFDQRVTSRLILEAAPPVATIPIREMGLFGGLRIWGQAQKGVRYVVSADTSEGTGGDEGAATVREFGTGLQVAALNGQFKRHEFGVLLVRVAKTFGDALLVVERNNHGHAILECVEHTCKYKNIFRDRDKKLGWMTHEVTRMPALSALEHAHRDGTWRSMDLPTLREFNSFIVNKEGKPEAEPGELDDLVMAEAICWDVLRRPVPIVTRDLDMIAEM